MLSLFVAIAALLAGCCSTCPKDEKKCRRDNPACEKPCDRVCDKAGKEARAAEKAEKKAPLKAKKAAKKKVAPAEN